VTTAWIEYFQGQFDLAEKGFKQSFIMGMTRKLPTMLIAGGAGLIIVTMRSSSSKEDLEKALKDLENNLEKIAEEPVDQEKLLLYGTRGLVNLELGNIERARELTKQGLELVNVTHEYQLFDLVAYTSLAETTIELWESGYMDDTLEEDVLSASRALHLFAQIVPIARPRAWMYQARANWLNGDYKRAQRALNTAISEAQALHMPYDEGIAYYHLGRLGIETDPDAGNHLQVALERLTQVGADEQIRHVQELLDRITGKSPNM
jgi:tetratricopeptide (TPR) repeat protein